MHVYKCYYERLSLKFLMWDYDMKKAFFKALNMENVITGELKRIDYVRRI